MRTQNEILEKIDSLTKEITEGFNTTITKCIQLFLLEEQLISEPKHKETIYEMIRGFLYHPGIHLHNPYIDTIRKKVNKDDDDGT